MSEWARENGFRSVRAGQPPPAPLDGLDVSPRLMVSSGLLTLLDYSLPIEGATRIHLLHRQLDWPLAPAGLRPMTDEISFLDRFNLHPYPMITSNERFLAIGVDSLAARQIADAMRTLLPADIGLLIHHRAMLIDFSSRHFDTIEFERMIALSDQLAKHLPTPRSVQ